MSNMAHWTTIFAHPDLTRCPRFIWLPALVVYVRAILVPTAARPVPSVLRRTAEPARLRQNAKTNRSRHLRTTLLMQCRISCARGAHLHRQTPHVADGGDSVVELLLLAPAAICPVRCHAPPPIRSCQANPSRTSPLWGSSAIRLHRTDVQQEVPNGMTSKPPQFPTTTSAIRKLHLVWTSTDNTRRWSKVGSRWRFAGVSSSRIHASKLWPATDTQQRRV